MTVDKIRSDQGSWHNPSCSSTPVRIRLREQMVDREISVDLFIDLMAEAIELCDCTKTGNGPTTVYEGTQPRSTADGSKEHVNCKWQKVGGRDGYWVDNSHGPGQGQVSYSHPRGWCDQGCCR